jgi:hypothetical protein
MTSSSSQVISKFNRYHQSASFLKVQLNDAYATWLQSKVDSNEWTLFTCTVVFKPIDYYNPQSRFEDTYKSRFLQKIRKRLESNSSNQLKSIPFEDLFYFERNHKTVLRSNSRRSPFHIHSVIPIKSKQVYRFWSYDENKLNTRLHKDLLSIDLVQNVLIEPVRESNTFPWLMYITKQKLM